MDKRDVVYGSLSNLIKHLHDMPRQEFYDSYVKAATFSDLDTGVTYQAQVKYRDAPTDQVYVVQGVVRISDRILASSSDQIAIHRKAVSKVREELITELQARELGGFVAGGGRRQIDMTKVRGQIDPDQILPPRERWEKVAVPGVPAQVQFMESDVTGDVTVQFRFEGGSAGREARTLTERVGQAYTGRLPRAFVADLKSIRNYEENRRTTAKTDPAQLCAALVELLIGLAFRSGENKVKLSSFERVIAESMPHFEIDADPETKELYFCIREPGEVQKDKETENAFLLSEGTAVQAIMNEAPSISLKQWRQLAEFAQDKWIESPLMMPSAMQGGVPGMSMLKLEA